MSTQAPLEPIRLRYPIDPTVDCVFKALFGQEENKGLLVHFLNSILHPKSPIEQVTYLSPINDPRTEDEKLTVIDIRACDEAGVTYHVEMQLQNHKALPERMLHNWSAIYHRLLMSGDDFEKLTPVISIWLLGHRLFKNPAYHHHFTVVDEAHSVRLSDHFHIHTLELKKWTRPVEGANLEDLWLNFFRYAKGWQELPESLNQNPQMRQAMTVLKHFSDDDRARYEYERRMQALSVQTTIDNERKRTQEELQQAKAELQQAKEERQQQQAELQQQQAELQQQQAELQQQQAELQQANELLEQKDTLLEQKDTLLEQEAARAEQAQTNLLNQAQALRQNLKNIYIRRFNAPPPQDLAAVLDAATLEQLNAWLLLFATAEPAELLALASP